MKGFGIKEIVCLVLIVLLIAFAAYQGMTVADLSKQVAVEKATTPTPVPVVANVMLVTPDPAAPTRAPVLRTGSKGDAVVQLQARLQSLGYYNGALDGEYGPATKAAVTLFQEQNDLGADGIVGTETSEILYSAYAKPCAATPTPTPEPTPQPTEVPMTGASIWYRADGLPLLVNADHPLPDGYRTVDLVNMAKYCDKSIVTIKANGIEGERLAVDALMEMLTAAKADGISPWQISAGYRSVKYQRQLMDNKIAEYKKQGLTPSKAATAAKKVVAEPGCSEHHTGLAFDITVPGASFKGTKQAKWLEKHCWDYGFILRYQDDKVGITGISSEPWHFRYVGVEHALRMRDEGLCLEEYIQRYGRE